MRVALVFDMEGTSHIGDIEETLPTFVAYWRTGRSKLTDDVVAAARGLLDGGAEEVVVFSHHGAGAAPWPNVLAERFPAGVRMAPPGVEDIDIGRHADVMFQVGVHAPGGSPSFMSHTLLPGLRLRIGDELLSESHLWAWSAAIPVLGMVGSRELGEMRGSLGEVPFLAVQHSIDRANAQPVYADPGQTSAEIQAFAAAACRDAQRRGVLSPRGPIQLDASLQNGDDAARELAVAGWTRLDRTTYRIERETWRSDDDALFWAIDAAATAAWVPYGPWFDGLDPTSEQTARAFPPERQAWSAAISQAWVADAPPLWFDPGAVDAPYEGLAEPI